MKWVPHWTLSDDEVSRNSAMRRESQGILAVPYAMKGADTAASIAATETPAATLIPTIED